MHIAARPETVFPFFTDPARYVQWMGSARRSNRFPAACYRVGMRDGVEAAGEFVEVDPPHRLVFTWGWTHESPSPPGTHPRRGHPGREDGGTRVVLRHHDLPDEEQRAHHRGGWDATSTGSPSAPLAATPARSERLTPAQVRKPRSRAADPARCSSIAARAAAG